jgi:hypothetical protein
MPFIPYRSGFYGVTTQQPVAQPLNAFQEEEMAKAAERRRRGEVSELEKNSLLNDVAARALGLHRMSTDGMSHALQPAVRGMLEPRKPKTGTLLGDAKK